MIRGPYDCVSHATKAARCLPAKAVGSRESCPGEREFRYLHVRSRPEVGVQPVAPGQRDFAGFGAPGRASGPIRRPAALSAMSCASRRSRVSGRFGLTTQWRAVLR